MTDSKLKYFFMGYFGATWPEVSGPTWQDVVHKFIRKNPPETVEQAASELQDLISRELDETELRRVITRELGANIYPPGSNLTYQGWLESVLRMLKEKR